MARKGGLEAIIFSVCGSRYKIDSAHESLRSPWNITLRLHYVTSKICSARLTEMSSRSYTVTDSNEWKSTLSSVF